MGTIIAIAFSYSAYRMAKRTGRSIVLWIVTVWVLGTVFAVMLGFLGAAIDFMAAKEEDLESGSVQPYISFWGGFAGTVIGGATAALLAGMPLPAVSVPQAMEAQIVNDRPPT